MSMRTRKQSPALTASASGTGAAPAPETRATQIAMPARVRNPIMLSPPEVSRRPPPCAGRGIALMPGRVGNVGRAFRPVNAVLGEEGASVDLGPEKKHVIPPPTWHY